MIPKLIRLGIETTLKIIWEEITIINIQIVNKNDKFNWIVDELYIKAESIIFNISNININISDLVFRFTFNNKEFFRQLLRCDKYKINKR